MRDVLSDSASSRCVDSSARFCSRRACCAALISAVVESAIAVDYKSECETLALAPAQLAYGPCPRLGEPHVQPVVAPLTLSAQTDDLQGAFQRRLCFVGDVRGRAPPGGAPPPAPPHPHPPSRFQVVEDRLIGLVLSARHQVEERQRRPHQHQQRQLGLRGRWVRARWGQKLVRAQGGRRERLAAPEDARRHT